jgi:hypothetical protein
MNWRMNMDTPAQDGSVETRLVKHNKGSNPNAKFSEEMVQRLESLFREGHSMEMALALAGVGKKAFANWIRRSKNGDPYYLNIHARVETARAEADTPAIHTWKKAIEGQVVEKRTKAIERKPMLHKDGTPVLLEDGTPRESIIIQERIEMTEIPGDWKAAESWLAKRRPQEWSAAPILLFDDEPVQIKVVNYREGLAGLVDAPKPDAEGKPAEASDEGQ